MDFDKIVISNFQLKVLKLLRFKKYANIYQIHGYLKFPDFTMLLVSIQDLEKLEFIYKDDFNLPADYKITNTGDKYLIFLKRTRLKKLTTVIGILAALSSIAGFLVALLKK